MKQKPMVRETDDGTLEIYNPQQTPDGRVVARTDMVGLDVPIPAGTRLRFLRKPLSERHDRSLRVRITGSLHDRIVAEAERTGQSVAAVVEGVLADYYQPT